MDKSLLGVCLYLAKTQGRETGCVSYNLFMYKIIYEINAGFELKYVSVRVQVLRQATEISVQPATWARWSL